MIKVQFPEPVFQIKEQEGKEIIYDSLRRQWLKLTPEEWVRQNFLQYIIQTKKYPSSYIAVEKEIHLGELKKRFDILVYDQHHQPWMIIECKAMDVELTEKVLEQIVRYNISVPVPFLVITNGSYTYAWMKKGIELIEAEDLPDFDLK
jgi:type I site-specific restriction endonuclease